MDLNSCLTFGVECQSWISISICRLCRAMAEAIASAKLRPRLAVTESVVTEIELNQMITCFSFTLSCVYDGTLFLLSAHMISLVLKQTLKNTFIFLNALLHLLIKKFSQNLFIRKLHFLYIIQIRFYPSLIC